MRFSYTVESSQELFDLGDAGVGVGEVRQHEVGAGCRERVGGDPACGDGDGG
jgi:hypothetical protein